MLCTGVLCVAQRCFFHDPGLVENSLDYACQPFARLSHILDYEDVSDHLAT